MNTSLEDIAKQCQVPVAEVEKAHKSGLLKAVEGSNPPEFTPEAIQEWLSSCEVKAFPQPGKN